MLQAAAGCRRWAAEARRARVIADGKGRHSDLRALADCDPGRPLALRDNAAARIVVVVVAAAAVGPQRSAMMPSFVTRLSGEGQRMEPARWRMLEPMNERHQPWVAVCDVFVGLWEKEREISSLCRLSVIRMTVCVDVLRGP